MSEASLPLGTVRGVIRVPGSKSAAIRALALATLAPGESRLNGISHGEDVVAMTRVVRGFGGAVQEWEDHWSVSGRPLAVPGDVLDAGESGLTARVALAMAGLADGEVTVTGRGRLRERPLAPLLDALRALGVEVRGDTDRLPVTIRGRGRLDGGRVTVATDTSTQFLSAVLIVGPMADAPLEVETSGSSGAKGYVTLTLDLMDRFGVGVEATDGGYRVPATGYRPAEVEIPPDASSAAYPLVGAAITAGRVEIQGLDAGNSHPDMALVDLLSRMGCVVDSSRNGLVLTGPETLEPIEADLSGAPDAALALAVACLFADGTSTLTGLGTWRHKESDRLMAMSEGLTRLGGRVWASDEAMEITPVSRRGATVRSHGDHRIAMALALAGLRLEGVAVDDADAVAKTWPGYWEAMRSLVSSETER